MKKKKDQENRVSAVCEPTAAYNTASSCAKMAVGEDHNAVSTMPEDCMSVDEYFNKLRTMVNEYYDNSTRPLRTLRINFSQRHTS